MVSQDGAEQIGNTKKCKKKQNKTKQKKKHWKYSRRIEGNKLFVNKDVTMAPAGRLASYKS